jgi:hypothetical protein
VNFQILPVSSRSLSPTTSVQVLSGTLPLRARRPGALTSAYAGRRSDAGDEVADQSVLKVNGNLKGF